MANSTGQARTQHAAKYIQQLCKHWSHKLQVEQSGNTGLVRFPAGTALMAAEPARLTVTITADDQATLDRLKDVLAAHLDRFAFREAPLPFEWAASAPANASA